MSERLPYEDKLQQQLNDLPLPDENKAWADMKRRLEEDDDNGAIIWWRQGCMLWGLLLIALLKAEFFHDKDKIFFKAGLFFGALCIACMSLGQNLANADEDVFQLSSYLSTTMLSYLFILLYFSNFIREYLIVVSQEVVYFL